MPQGAPSVQGVSHPAVLNRTAVPLDANAPDAKANAHAARRRMRPVVMEFVRLDVAIPASAVTDVVALAVRPDANVQVQGNVVEPGPAAANPSLQAQSVDAIAHLPRAALSVWGVAVAVLVRPAVTLTVNVLDVRLTAHAPGNVAELQTASVMGSAHAQRAVATAHLKHVRAVQAVLDQAPVSVLMIAPVSSKQLVR